MQFTGIGSELGFGSGMTCWRRVRNSHKAGVFEALHKTLLAHCHAAGLIDFDRVIPGGSHVRAERRGADIGPSPVDRRKTGSKHHTLAYGNGIPLAITLSAPTQAITWCCPSCSTESRCCTDDPARPRRRIRTLMTDKATTTPRPRRTAVTREHWSNPTPRYPRQSLGPVGRRTIPGSAPPIPSPGHPLGRGCCTMQVTATR